MIGTERLSSEQAFHDDQASRRAETFVREPRRLSFTDECFLNHETWIRPAFHQLGDLQGLHVLDFGCGHGMAAVVLARHGARVTAFDLSRGYLQEARTRVMANSVDVRFVQANGERLPFADYTFDRVWGNAVLHHLDLRIAVPELRRVLKPGGLAVFCEPWGGNPVLNWARNRVPYPGKQRTADEEPLQRGHIRLLRKAFPNLEIRGYQLLSMARRVLQPGRLVAGLDWCDAMLLARVPALEKYCRYVVLTLCRDSV